MKQDMIVILDLGSTENTVLAREIRELGVYSEIHPHDITEEEIKALDNVKGIIADCGFTSPWDIIKHVAKERFHLPPFPLMYMVDLISEVVAGFGLKEVSIPEIMKRNKIPVLFIHGDADNYVPMWMTIKNYEACAAPKELYIVPGAGHALAFSKDMEEGKRRIKDFINKYKTI